MIGGAYFSSMKMSSSLMANVSGATACVHVHAADKVGI